ILHNMSVAPRRQEQSSTAKSILFLAHGFRGLAPRARYCSQG
ncbi:hypothetical protein A2U01_0070222, partial [Trifolium medium]|nr:hypothetical protein [Trifolium medium]